MNELVQQRDLRDEGAPERVRVDHDPFRTALGPAFCALSPASRCPHLKVRRRVSQPSVAGEVQLKIPPGTQSGQTFRLSGRGVPRAKGAGDQYVKIKIAVPKSLDVLRKAFNG